MEQILTENMQAMYKAYQVVIPPHTSKEFNTVYSFFTCIEANELFEVRFSSSVGFTQFEQGLYTQFNHLMDYLLIHNPNDAPLVLKFGVGSGRFEDNRLTVTTTVKTQPAQYALFNASTLTIADGSATVPVAQRVIIQNTGSNVMYIGGSGTDGLQLQPQGTFEYSSAEELTIYGTDGDTLAVGEWN